MAEKKAGRPPKYKNKKDIEKLIEAYFESCESQPYTNKDGSLVTDKAGRPVMRPAKPLTITGLALALGFNSRQSLLNYQDKPEFMDTITRAKAKIEQYTEERLFDKDGANGAKFSLANNFEGWREKQQIDATVAEKLKLEDLI